MYSWLKRTLSAAFGTSDQVSEQDPSTVVIPRSEHAVSRANISENALKVLYRLKQAGYQGFLVGGGVRDLLLGREPKDFDIATDARPEEVRRLFRNCRLIGRRFRLAHVHFGREIIEVATFRGQGDGEQAERLDENGLLVRDNVFGTLEEDAWRRDFTVNALYYDIRDFSVVDYTGGLPDLEAGRLRVIGDPVQRFREDPVRMLRAIRFAAKLGFRIDGAAESAIYELGHLLEEVSPARLFDESLKLFQSGYAVQTYELLRHYHLFGYLFPESDAVLQEEEEGFPHVFVARALGNTDTRVRDDKPITPAFLFAALLWEPIRQEFKVFRGQGVPEIEAIQLAGEAVTMRQIKHVAFPKRFTVQSREIWTLQERLKRRGGKRAERLMEHPRFRAAYDLLLLRGECGDEEALELSRWWTDYQRSDVGTRVKMAGSSRPPRRRGRRHRRKPAGKNGGSPESS